MRTIIIFENAFAARVGLRHALLVLAIFSTFVVAKSLPAADFPVSSAADIAATLSQVQPGDTLVMQDGIWTNQQINFSALGTSSSPITLRPQTPGGVTLNGNSSLNITGDWLVADGLRFEGGGLSSNDHIVEFRGNRGEATNSRLTNSTIVNYNPADINTRYFWVSLYGRNNRVDHNHFEGQNHSGVTVTVWRNSNAPQHHQIDSNYFGPRPEGNGNGFEAIRIGTSDQSLSDSFTIVENNLFEQVDGEIEIISNKSGNNTFRYNTFRESAGTLTLRHGNDALVEGNFFLGNNKDRSGGVRVIGERQTLINNYFSGLDGRADGAISISAGVDGSSLNEYYQVKDALIAHNTIVNVNEAAITFDHGFGSSDRTLLAEDVTIANNLIRSTLDPLFEGTQGSGWIWEGNIAHGQSLGSASGTPGIQVIDPQLSQDATGLWRPGSGSPAIDGATDSQVGLVTTDMDGQARIGLLDVGADEFSTAMIVRKPLEQADVGPTWLNGGGGVDPVDPGCNGPGALAVQAENYTSVFDPDGDNQTWQLQTNADALDGMSMQTPDHSRVNLDSGDQHQSLLVYDVEFSEAGTYTAYYRARGFDTSSDSIFTPSDFDADPNITESLSNDGLYRWEVGDTFSISSSDVGVPLEFRLGAREGLADLDAFVFHLDGGLTASELDALFTVDCQADLNSDGKIDCADIDALVAEIAAGTDSADFDLTGNGVVDNVDLNEWLTHAGAVNLQSSNSYLLGDANLDGVVDISDLNLWSANKFTTNVGWCGGDFNADGVADVSDLNIWSANKFQAADVASVPEPATPAWLGFFVLLLLQRRFPR